MQTGALLVGFKPEGFHISRVLNIHSNHFFHIEQVNLRLTLIGVTLFIILV